MSYPTTYCGNTQCSSDSLCYITENSLTCSSSPISSWRLNSTLFPPIEYVGLTPPGDSSDAACENLQIKNDTIKSQVSEWASQFWTPGKLPIAGTFYNPLEIGSCIDDLSGNQPNLYCKAGKCKPKLQIYDLCLSSNHCLTYICAISEASQQTCQPDPFGKQILKQLTGNFSRPANVHYLGPPPQTQPSAGQVIAIASCVVILLTSLLTIMYAKKICKKHDEATQDADNRVGSRIRRGASLLLSGSILTRQNSSATLPRYTVEGDPSMLEQLLNWFMPPGELPPTYESVVENENSNIDGRQGGRTYDTADLEADAGEGSRSSGDVSERSGENEGGEEASSEPNNGIETDNNRAQSSRATSLITDNNEEDEETYRRVSMSSSRNADDDNADETTVLNRDTEES
ncbi:8057_t:CDS:1 [Paraglomus brasilianum]|uniref:8057_t:CDS:1 n=1 Tax=Paraglomus brasilianum TaxID=144538 RepID=A0A9N9FJG3_9GLOM|nr:8057_t:CDS:1 [Paraglomus brasilianum]